MTLAALGPWQLIIGLLFLVGIFLLGYTMGKKAGYIKRVKEKEN